MNVTARGWKSSSSINWNQRRGEVAVEETATGGQDGNRRKRGEPSRKRSAQDLTVADADAFLDCGVCSLPLKPPIFQVRYTHYTCIRIDSNLYACSIAVRRGPRSMLAVPRQAQEHQQVPHLPRHRGRRLPPVPCHGARGGVRPSSPCARTQPTAAPPRRLTTARAEHLRACPHAPCYCPGDACGFAGNTAALRDHITRAHGWPYMVEPYPSCYLRLRLHDGFNFVGSAKGDLLLLNVTRRTFCRGVSVVCVRPHGATAAEEKRLELVLTVEYDNSSSGINGLVNYEQKARFQVAFSDLSDGLTADSNDYHNLFLLNMYYVHGDDKDVEVTVEIFYQGE